MNHKKQDSGKKIHVFPSPPEGGIRQCYEIMPTITLVNSNSVFCESYHLDVLARILRKNVVWM